MSLTEKERQLLRDPTFIKKVCENFKLYTEIGRMAQADSIANLASIAGEIARVLRAQAMNEADK